MKPFRFGIINQQMKPPIEWGAHVQRVEALGFSSFLLRDHFTPDFFGHQYAPLIALTMAASLTRELHVGTLVLDNDYRHPVMLAKEAATLDYLSNGRFELGLGAGWLRSEYEQAGMTFDANPVRVQRLAEAINVIKGLLGESEVNFAGDHYKIQHLNGFPKPVQRPHLPLLIGAGQKKMLMLAGQEGNIVGLLTTSVATGTLLDYATERLAEAVAQKLEWVRQGAGARFDALELSLIPSLMITDDRRGRAEQLIAERGWTSLNVEQILAMPSILIGTIEEIADTLIQRREQYGFSYYIFSDEVLETAAPLVEALRGQ